MSSEELLARAYKKRLGVARRAEEMGQLRDRNEPLEFMRWAAKVWFGFFCPELEETAEKVAKGGRNAFGDEEWES